MAQRSARDLAHQILTRDLARLDKPTPVAVAAAAELVFHRLSENLIRWLGPEGSHALFTRALELAQAEHRSLRVIPPPARSALFFDALAANAEPHDTGAVMDGVVMIMITLIDLLTRLIGEDLTVRLVEESAPGLVADGTRPPRAERNP
jgi:hypothetical protein